MNLKRLMRAERMLRLGGYRISSLGLSFGGKWVTVSPITVLKFFSFFPVLEFCNFEKSTIDKVFEDGDLNYLRAILPLLIDDPITEKEMMRTTRDQIIQCWRAFQEVNDLDFLLDKVKSSIDKHDREALEFVDVAVIFSQHFPMITPQKVLQLPMQYVYAVFDSLNRINDYKKSGNADGQRGSVSAEEKQKIINSLQMLGFGVH